MGWPLIILFIDYDVAFSLFGKESFKSPMYSEELKTEAVYVIAECGYYVEGNAYQIFPRLSSFPIFLSSISF